MKCQYLGIIFLAILVIVLMNRKMVENYIPLGFPVWGTRDPFITYSASAPYFARATREVPYFQKYYNPQVYKCS